VLAKLFGAPELVLGVSLIPPEVLVVSLFGVFGVFGSFAIIINFPPDSFF
jgi:hypothetical protein